MVRVVSEPTREQIPKPSANRHRRLAELDLELLWLLVEDPEDEAVDDMVNMTRFRW